MITNPADARRAMMHVRCPHCRVPAGARCVVPSSGRSLGAGRCHPARIGALAEHFRGGAA